MFLVWLCRAPGERAPCLQLSKKKHCLPPAWILYIGPLIPIKLAGHRFLSHNWYSPSEFPCLQGSLKGVMMIQFCLLTNRLRDCVQESLGGALCSTDCLQRWTQLCLASPGEREQGQLLAGGIRLFLGREPPPHGARGEDRLSAGTLCRSSRVLFAEMYLDSNHAAVNLQPYPLGGIGSSVRVQELSLVSWRSGIFSRTFGVLGSEVL